MFTKDGRLRTVNGSLRTGDCACCKDEPACLNYPMITTSGSGCSTVFYGYTIGGSPMGSPVSVWEGSSWIGGTLHRPICSYWGRVSASVGVGWYDAYNQWWYYGASEAFIGVSLDRWNYDPGKVCVGVYGQLIPSVNNPIPDNDGFFYSCLWFDHWDCYTGGRDISVSGRTATVSIDNQACRWIDGVTFDSQTNVCTDGNNVVQIGFGNVPGSRYGGMLDTIVGCPCTMELEWQL